MTVTQLRTTPFLWSTPEYRTEGTGESLRLDVVRVDLGRRDRRVVRRVRRAGLARARRRPPASAGSSAGPATVSGSSVSAAAAVEASSSITSATADTWSSSRMFMSRKPWALRPSGRKSRTAMRWTMPFWEMNTSWWCSRTTSAPARRPLASVCWIVLTPLAPRVGLAVVADQRALAEAVRRSRRAGTGRRARCPSRARRRRPARPCRARRWCRGPSPARRPPRSGRSGRRCETIRTSSPSSTRRTATSSSSSRMLMAMMPSALIGVL